MVTTGIEIVHTHPVIILLFRHFLKTILCLKIIMKFFNQDLEMSGLDYEQPGVISMF